MSTPDDRYSESRDELGRGGVGRVDVVHDRHLGRDVARKQPIVPIGALGATSRLRFEREARIAARLEHPNILPVHDLAWDADGTPWYTTRVIRGRSLDAALAAAPSMAERLRLLPSIEAVGQALAFAHSQGVIHRDVTPKNIMVGPFGETVLIDWGLARVLGDASPDPESVGSPNLTLEGVRHGTVAYASPEQITGDLHHIDCRTDVFGLGATLYHLLTGRPPRAAQDAPRRLIPPARSVSGEIPPELASIADHALALAPSDRYADVRGLLDDLEAWRLGRPVSAHRYSSADHLRRVARNRAAELVIAAAAAAVVAVLATGALAVWIVKDAREEEAFAGAEAATAVLAGAEGRHGAAARHALASLAIRENPEVRGSLVSAGRRWLPRPDGTWALPDCPERWAGPGARFLCVGADVRVYEAGARRATIPLAAAGSSAAFSPSGRRVALGLPSRELVTLDVDSGAVTRAPTADVIVQIAWRDEDTLVLAGEGGAVWVGDRLVRPPAPGGRITAIAVEGDALALGSATMAEVWSSSPPTLVWKKDGIAASYLNIDRGALIATTAGFDGDPFVRVYDLDDGALVASAAGTTGGYGRPIVSVDRQTLLVPTDLGGLVLLAIPSLAVRAHVDLDGPRSSTLALHGDRVHAARPDGTVERWILPDRAPARAVRAGEGLVFGVALSPDGRRLLTSSHEGVVRTWDWPSLQQVREAPVAGRLLQAVAWRSPDEALVSDTDGNIHRIGINGERGAFPTWGLTPYLLVPLGERVAAAGSGGHVGVWEVDSGAPIWQRDLDGSICGLLPMDGGRSLLAAKYGGRLVRFRAADGAIESDYQYTRASLWGAPARSPEGAVAMGLRHADGSATIERRNPVDWTPRWAVATPARSSMLAWSPDGRWIAATGVDGSVNLLDAATGSLRARVRAHAGQAWAATFVDATSLVTTGSDGMLRAWDLTDLDD